MKKDTLEYRMMLEQQRLKSPDSEPLTGSIKDKYPVILDGGRTTIFISDKSKEAEAIQKYELRKDNRVMFHYKKPKS